jgi:DNA-binding beta-propeller fold protein YncE
MVAPVYVHFEAQPALTLALATCGALLLIGGSIMLYLSVLYAGAGLTLSTIAWQAATQPVLLGVPLTAVWPLRILLVLLVGGTWALLMRPPAWLGRALVAGAVPTLLILLLWGGPATGAALFGWNISLPAMNFAPYWLAVDNRGTLYATDAAGDLVWVFDASGAPKGTLRPGWAPVPPTPGPGILPNGMEEELGLPPMAPSSTGQGQGIRREFTFCGIAVDPDGNLYLVDSRPIAPLLLRFDHNGMITARWNLPAGYRPGRDCVEADRTHIYLSSFYGQVYIMDHEARVLHEVALSYRPLAMALNGKDDLLVLGPSVLNHINIESGQMLTTSLSLPPTSLQQARQSPYPSMMVTLDGRVLIYDPGSVLLSVDPYRGTVLGQFGERGHLPGQFAAIAGITQDAQGRLYVADPAHRVVQRFNPDGRLDSLIWAALSWPGGHQDPSDPDRIEVGR